MSLVIKRTLIFSILLGILWTKPAAADLSTGLVAYWKFDEVTTATTPDSSGNSHHGSLAQSAELSTDVPLLNFPNSRSLRLNGVNEYMSAPTLGGFGSIMDTGPIAISFWAKTQTRDVFFIGSLNLGFTTAFYVYVLDSGGIEWFVRGEGDVVTSIDSVAPPGGINNDQWRHILVTKTGQTVEDMAVYVDGNRLDLSASLAQGANQSTIDLAFPVLIGAANNRGTPSNHAKGFVDEVRIYNRVLSESEISFLAAGYDHMPEATKPGLPPQFSQGKGVFGKVFWDLNENGIQDEGEKGIEGIKVASDTGIYAITDEDGKYHYPYIETGQRLLKIDPSTLPEGVNFTTDNPRKVTVTEGILTKVSFGVTDKHLRQDVFTATSEESTSEASSSGPLLKVSMSQDPLELKKNLSVTHSWTDDATVDFKITCNYRLFVSSAELLLYDQGQNLVKTIVLPHPVPYNFVLDFTQMGIDGDRVYYYQLKIHDTESRTDSTELTRLR